MVFIYVFKKIPPSACGDWTVAGVTEHGGGCLNNLARGHGHFGRRAVAAKIDRSRIDDIVTFVCFVLKNLRV